MSISSGVSPRANRTSSSTITSRSSNSLLMAACPASRRGEEQEIVDESLHLDRVTECALARGHQVNSLQIAICASELDFQRRPESGQRRPELVRGIGHEPALRGRRRLEPGEHLVHRRGEADRPRRRAAAPAPAGRAGRDRSHATSAADRPRRVATSARPATTRRAPGATSASGKDHGEGRHQRPDTVVDVVDVLSRPRRSAADRSTVDSGRNITRNVHPRSADPHRCVPHRRPRRRLGNADQRRSVLTSAVQEHDPSAASTWAKRSSRRSWRAPRRVGRGRRLDLIGTHFERVVEVVVEEVPHEHDRDDDGRARARRR